MPKPVLSDKAPAPLAIPDPDAQTAAVAKIKDIFRDEYAKPSTSDRIALANKLLVSAEQSDGDPAGKYELLSEAWRLSSAAGDVTLALKTLDELTADFVIDQRQWRKATFDALGRASMTDAQARLLVSAWLNECDAAQEARDVDRISRAVAGVDAALHKVNDLPFSRHAHERTQQAREIVSQYGRVKSAMDQINAGQEDPAADYAAGRFECLYVQDWQQGLPLLARGTPGPLATAAKTDLDGANNPTEQVTIGDGWWDAADREAGLPRNNAKARAVFWYQQAVDQIKGLEQTKVRKRVASMTSFNGKSLLDLPDPEKDAISGTWKADPDGLISSGGILEIPYLFPDEYDLEVEFKLEGSAVASLVLTKGKATVDLVLGGFDNKYIGFEMVHGMRASVNPAAASKPRILDRNRVYRLKVQVRNLGVDVFLDGKRITSYEGDWKDVGLAPGQPPMRDGGTIGLTAWAGQVTYHSLELSEVTGQGKRLVKPTH